MKSFFLLFFPLILFASLHNISLQLPKQHSFEFAGFYAAVEQGYYKELGLKLEIKEFDKNSTDIDSVLNLDTTFAIASSSLVLEKELYPSLILIASYYKENNIILPSSQNKSTSLIHNYSAYKLPNNKIYINSQLRKDTNVSTYEGEVFTSLHTIENSQQIVVDFIKATNKGWEYAFANKESVIQLIQNKYHPKLSSIDLIKQAQEVQSFFKTSSFNIGSILLPLIKRHTQVYNKLNMIDFDVNDDYEMKQFISSYIHKKDAGKESLIQFSKRERDFIQKEKIFRIANKMDSAPFDYNEFGKPTGLSIAYVRLLFDKAGLKYKFVNGFSSLELLDLFKDKKIDVMPTFYKNNQTKEYALFSSLYYKERLALYAIDTKIQNFNDLKNQKIAVLKENVNTKLLKKHFKRSQIIQYDSMDELIENIHVNNVSALIANTLQVDYYKIIKNLPQLRLLHTISIPTNIHKDGSLYIGMQKTNPILHSIIQKTIISLHTDEIKKLKRKWFIHEIHEKIHLNSLEKKYLQKKDITMCVRSKRMPYEMLQNSQYIGISAEYFKIIENNLNIKIDILSSDSNEETLQLIQEEKCDLFSLNIKTSEQEKYMQFADSNIHMTLVLATKLTVAFIADLKDLENKKIGITKGYAFKQEIQKKYPNLDIVEVENIKDGLTKVQDGKLFGYIDTLASVGHVFQTSYIGELKIASKLDTNLNLHLGIANDNPILFSIMNQAIQSISEEQRKTIRNKWLSIKYQNIPDNDLLWQVIFLSIIILLTVLYWNKKLSNINSELEEVTKAKASFLANMSHEIRTPMNSILGMTYLIKETNLNKNQAQYIEKIETSSNNLLSLLNDILDLSKIEAKKLKLEKREFNLLDVLNVVGNLMSVERYEKDLEFNIIYDKLSSTNYYGDEIKLTQILTNLISNAVKFTEQGVIELYIEKLNARRVRFRITDTGIGLTSKQIKNIFSSFTQADSSITRKYGGTGLGLSISRELVELMRGKIWVESRIGYGSQFIFEIELEIRRAVINKESLHTKKESTRHLHKPKLDKEKSTLMFKQLKEAVSKRRPQLCLPLLKDFETYALNQTDKKLFDSLSVLIVKYKFDKAKELLHEY